MYASPVVDPPHVDELLAAGAGNLVGQALLGQGLPGGLDDVHLVAGARGAGGEVLEAGGAGELEDEVLGAEAEACQMLEDEQLNRERE